MTYSEFTLQTFRRQLGVNVRDGAFFDTVGEIAISTWLGQSLEAGMSAYTTTEKARGELIIAPILLECRSHVTKGINLFSGVPLVVDPETGLVGEFDFILARTQSRLALQTPLMVVDQARNHDIEECFGECAAQMLGVMKFNERYGTMLPHVYGCVTNGYSWVFLKLQPDELQFHPQRLAFNEVSKIVWFIVQCLKDVDQQASAAA